MGLIKSKPFAFFIAMVFALAFPLYGQNAGPSLLAEEIQSLEKKLTTPGALSFADHRFTLTRLARLLLLSGNTEAAADAWNKAAFAEPDKRDDRSLLEGVRCYIALGELDSAEAGVRMVLQSGSNLAMIREGRFLDCLIEAFRTGNVRSLSRLLDDGEYAGRMPAILYSLWKISGEETWQTRLRSEYPASPEARSLTADPPSISTASTPMWFLFSGREGIGAVPAPVPDQPPPVPRPLAPPPPVSAPAQRSTVIQVGVFGREANAKTLAERLTKAGFSPSITGRPVNGAIHFVVTVPPGDNINASLRRLKNAGFEAFPANK